MTKVEMKAYGQWSMVESQGGSFGQGRHRAKVAGVTAKGHRCVDWVYYIVLRAVLRTNPFAPPASRHSIHYNAIDVDIDIEIHQYLKVYSSIISSAGSRSRLALEVGDSHSDGIIGPSFTHL